MQNEEKQKETKLRNKIKDVIKKLKETGLKANSDKSDKILDLCYQFIRSISTNVSFSSTKRISDGFYLELAIQKVNQSIYMLIEEENKKKLENDLFDSKEITGNAGSSTNNNGQAAAGTSKKNKKKKK